MRKNKRIIDDDETRRSFREGTKARLFLELIKLKGGTGPISTKVLEQNGLGFGNGGSWCRDDSPLGKKFIIRRNKEKGKIVSVDLLDRRHDPSQAHIPKDILKKIKKEKCVILFTSKPECDHKDGRKKDFRLTDTKSMVYTDFQALSKAANNAKRQHCKTCEKTGNRFDARKLGYKIGAWKGNGEWNGTCVGCYWHDPEKFNKEISKNASNPYYE